jgi:hypothetical protein
VTNVVHDTGVAPHILTNSITVAMTLNLMRCLPFSKLGTLLIIAIDIRILLTQGDYRSPSAE